MGFCYFSSKGRKIQTRVQSGVLLLDVLLDIIFFKVCQDVLFVLYYIYCISLSL